MTTDAPRAAATSAGPQVRTTTGVVRGRYEGGLAVFRGIPFAAPPVGAARFAAPRPAPRWAGVREAASFGPPPPQHLSPTGPRPATGAAAQPPGDDWLTVNVWTPGPDRAARRPVMVWIYGGRYSQGDAGGYDAGHLSRDGNLVAVSLNYRLGGEGFARIDGAPANRGLLDQIAALRWVRENIAGFGGEPSRITVFGESAGAGCIAALLAMPAAAGLFQRAILQSPPGAYFTDELARDISTTIAAAAGLRPTVADLSTADPWELPAAVEAVSGAMSRHAGQWGWAAYTNRLFALVVDGDILPAAPWQSLAG